MKRLTIPGVFLLLILLAFGHSLTQGFAPIDDIFLIVENLAIRGMTWENLTHVFTTYDPELYIPLVFVSFQLNWMIGGLNPIGFHFVNILLHVINALLVMRILFQLTNKKWLSYMAALLFAIHPLNTEAVVWLAGRKDLLVGIFFLASLTLYLDSEGKRKIYWASVACFLLALLSKVIAVTLLGVIVLHWLLIERNQKPETKNHKQNRNWLLASGFWFLIRLLPYLILSIIFAIVAMGGKGRVVAAVDTWDKILVACKSTIFYIQKLILPTDLTIIYPLQGNISLFDGHILTSVILTIILGAIAIISIRKRPWLTFGIGFYIATLAPTYLNIGKAGLVFFAVDRYAYLPSIGILFILIHILSEVMERFKNAGRIVGVAGSIVLVIFIVLSQVQTRVWDTPDKLYLKTLETYPESVGARVGLATIYRHQNKLPEAFEVLKEGLKYTDHMLLHLHAGYVYAKSGQVADAREQLQIAMEMEPNNPEPIFSLGSLLEKTGKPLEAIPLYEKAVALDDSYVIAHARLGMLYLENGREEEAREQFEAALKWNKFSPEAREGMELLKN